MVTPTCCQVFLRPRERLPTILSRDELLHIIATVLGIRLSQVLQVP